MFGKVHTKQFATFTEWNCEEISIEMTLLHPPVCMVHVCESTSCAWQMGEAENCRGLFMFLMWLAGDVRLFEQKTC
jgi:hypothetical protein